MAMSDDRQRHMPLPDDRSRNRGRPLAFPEAVLLINPVEPEFKGEVDDKYQYSCETKDLKVHGWISTDPPIGFWQITPSNEFRTGGPTKQELTSHVGPTNLAMFVSAHYGGSDLVIKFGDGEKWKKVFGPVFMYLNLASTGEEPLTLWKDAKDQMLDEVGKWPYSFPASKDYQQAHERGRISGQLFVHDRFITEGHMPASGASIGLAPPGNPGSWQRESKGYQFWTKTNDEGRFTIDNILAGTYDVYAWVHGFIGDYKNVNTIVITPGCDIKLGDLMFEPPRDGPTLWEIGVPDRSAAEFYIPDSDPMYTNKFLANDLNKFRQYGLWERYARLYHDGDLVFKIGQSDYKKDWFFAHVNREPDHLINNCLVKERDEASMLIRQTINSDIPLSSEENDCTEEYIMDGSNQEMWRSNIRKRYDIIYEKTTWTIKFELNDLNKTGTYKLRLALASAQLSDLQVRANDPNAKSPLFTTGVIGGDNAIARHGIHGLYWLFNVDIPGKLLNSNGENTIYLTKVNEGIIFPGGVMYDYIRLEGPPPS